MAVHLLTTPIESMFRHAISSRGLSDRLELGFGNRDGVDEGMDGWMDKGIVRMFCDKVIENKKLSDNLGENCG